MARSVSISTPLAPRRSGRALAAATSTHMQDNLPDFSKKIVLVYFESGAPNNVAAIESGRFEMQGGSLFLLGRGARSKMGWAPGIPTGIAWSKVQAYFLFDSAEDFNRLYYGSEKKPTG